MNKIFKNFLAILSGNITGKVLFFLFSIIIARAFGEEVFGSVNFANSIISYFLMISSMGLQTYAIIRIAKNTDEKENLFNKILSTRIILGIVSTILLIGIISSVNLAEENRTMTLLYGSIIITNALNIDWYFNAIQKMKYISFSIMIQNSVSLISLGIIYLFNISRSIYIIPMCIFIGNISSIIYSFIIALRDVKFKFTISLKESWYFIQKSFPFFFSGVFATINCNLDTILIGIIHTNLQVGLYSAAYKVINILVVGIAIIFTPVYPVIIELISSNKLEKFNTLMINLKKIILIIVIPLVMGGIILRADIITLLFSNMYVRASDAFGILLLYIGLLYYREIYGYTLNASGKQKVYMKIVSISATMNILLNIVIIPKYGIEGAAFTTVISEIINITLMRYFSKKIIKDKINFKILIKIIIATIIMCFGTFVLKSVHINILLNLGISIIIYLIAIFMLHILSIKEIKGLLGGEK